MHLGQYICPTKSCDHQPFWLKAICVQDDIARACFVCLLFSFLFASQESGDATQGMAVDGRSYGLGAGLTWAETAQPHVAQREVAIKCSNVIRVSHARLRVVKAPPSRVNLEIARETALSKVQKLEQTLLLSRLPRSCHRRSEARVGEGPVCVQETSNRCRTRTVPQVHLKVREGGRVGCGTFSRIQCSCRSEGSPPALGGRTSSSHEPPGTINTIASFTRCRDCCVEGQTRRGRRGERRCDPESVEQAPATMSCVASASADQPMHVTRVPREASGCRHATRSWDKHWSRETRPE